MRFLELFFLDAVDAFELGVVVVEVFLVVEGVFELVAVEVVGVEVVVGGVVALG